MTIFRCFSFMFLARLFFWRIYVISMFCSCHLLPDNIKICWRKMKFYDLLHLTCLWLFFYPQCFFYVLCFFDNKLTIHWVGFIHRFWVICIIRNMLINTDRVHSINIDFFPSLWRNTKLVNKNVTKFINHSGKFGGIKKNSLKKLLTTR